MIRHRREERIVNIVAAFFKFHQHKQNPHKLVLEADVSFTSPLTTDVVRNGGLATLSIESIHNDRVTFRTEERSPTRPDHLSGAP